MLSNKTHATMVNNVNGPFLYYQPMGCHKAFRRMTILIHYGNAHKKRASIAECPVSISFANYPFTRVPTGLPMITCIKLPSLFISKTIMGNLFSWQSVKAVMSITLRDCLYTSEKVIVS